MKYIIQPFRMLWWLLWSVLGGVISCIDMDHGVAMIQEADDWYGLSSK